MLRSPCAYPRSKTAGYYGAEKQNRRATPNVKIALSRAKSVGNTSQSFFSDEKLWRSCNGNGGRIYSRSKRANTCECARGGVNAVGLDDFVIPVLEEEYAGLAQYAGIVPLLDKLVRLSPRDIRIVEGMVQLMYAENGGKP